MIMKSRRGGEEKNVLFHPTFCQFTKNSAIIIVQIKYDLVVFRKFRKVIPHQ